MHGIEFREPGLDRAGIDDLGVGKSGVPVTETYNSSPFEIATSVYSLRGDGAGITVYQTPFSPFRLSA
jgi:hypothetical protein